MIHLGVEQVSGHFEGSGEAVCKTVGLAYVGRTQHLPPPAKIARELGFSRSRGPSCCCATVFHDVPL